MKNQHTKRNKIISALLLLVLLGGLSLLLYPIVSDCWNSFHQSQAITAYTEAVAEADDTSLKEWLMDAQLYNAALPPDQSRFKLSEEKKAVFFINCLHRISLENIREKNVFMRSRDPACSQCRSHAYLCLCRVFRGYDRNKYSCHGI